MTPSLSSKLPDHEASIFGTMSRMAAAEKALNLSQGYPDFGVDPELIRLMQEAVASDFNQYAPMPGIYSLREAISEKTFERYGAEYHPEHEITVTHGATQAIFTAMAASIRPGDEVIIFKPAYDCYEPSVKAHGGIPVLLQLSGPSFSIDWPALENAITPNTRMVVINSPHNPSGTILKEEDMLRLERLLQGTDILLLSDEVYEHLVFDGQQHQSACRFPGLRERAFICASFGKTFHVTGWKMGYCLAPRGLMAEFRKLHEFVVFSVNHPAQRAIREYLREPEHYQQLNAFFQQKRDLFLSGLQGSRFQWNPSEGTYFQLLDYSAISKEPDLEFSQWLTRRKKVASIPVSVFNLHREDRRQLRFCFAKSDDTLRRAAEILHEL